MTDEREQDRLLEEEHDGIREYDNPTPRWWIWLFAGTVVFAALYWLNVPGIGSGRGRIAQYESEMAEARARAAARAPAVGPSDGALSAMASDHETLEKGEKVFEANCTPCHRADGGGVIGPNLTDDYWIHGGRPSQILKTIEAGVQDKGMPAWGTVLRPEDLPAVAAWVLHLRGTKPGNPKPPQGTLVAREGGAVAED